MDIISSSFEKMLPVFIVELLNTKGAISFYSAAMKTSTGSQGTICLPPSLPSPYPIRNAGTTRKLKVGCLAGKCCFWFLDLVGLLTSGPSARGSTTYWINLQRSPLLLLCLTCSRACNYYNDLAISTTACRLHRDGDVFRLWDIRIRLFSSAGKPAG